jgi:hypothetical protein
MSSESSDNDCPSEDKSSTNDLASVDNIDNAVHLARKRSRVRSHQDDDMSRREITVNSTETAAISIDVNTNEQTQSETHVTNRPAGPVKRPRLHVNSNEVIEQDGTVNDSNEMTTASDNDSIDEL